MGKTWIGARGGWRKGRDRGKEKDGKSLAITMNLENTLCFDAISIC
jgi:hypothetical protein